MISIRLSPTRVHCIQTVSKWKYEHLMQEFLSRKDENLELIAQLELLYDFLQTANYSSLRAQCEQIFAAGKMVTCIIKRQGSGTGASCIITEQAEDHD